MINAYPCTTHQQGPVRVKGDPELRCFGCWIEWRMAPKPEPVLARQDHQQWLEYEDEQLIALRDEGYTFSEIASLFERTDSSIKNRYYVLCRQQKAS